MASVNPFKMTKAELQKFLTGRCKHYHFYYEHPACFIKEMGYPVRRGFLDIETSNLDADFGILLSYAIKVEDKRKIYGRHITKEELRSNTLDKQLVKECIKDMMRFDELVSYYGTRFDLKFLRSRALYWGLDFPEYGYIKHKDCYYMVRNRLKLHRNRLEDACRLLGIKGKTHLDGKIWVQALTGDEKALKYIFDHNKKDVIILEKLFKRLEVYVRPTNRSI